jgi:hypothetical protein
MKVKDLIEKLKEFDQDSLVVLSSDAEGNSYSKVSGDIEPYYFNEHSEEIFTDDDLSQDEADTLKKCVVIWP